MFSNGPANQRSPFGFAWTCDVGLSATLNAKRFDLGFYTGRAYGLAAVVFVLVMLLLGTRALYARLAGQLARDRDTATRYAQRVFETSLDLILVTNPYGKLLEVNGAARHILGYQPQEMISKIGRDFIYAPDLDATRKEMRAAHSSGVIQSFGAATCTGTAGPSRWFGWAYGRKPTISTSSEDA